MIQLTTTPCPKIAKASLVFHVHLVINNIVKGTIFTFEVSTTWKVKYFVRSDSQTAFGTKLRLKLTNFNTSNFDKVKKQFIEILLIMFKNEL